MISELLSRALGQRAEERTAAAIAVSPVRFLVKAATYYRGRPLEPGAVLEVPLSEAAEVNSWRLELVDPEADAERVRAESHRQTQSFEKGQRMAGVPWMGRVGG